MQSAAPHVLATLDRRHTPGARGRGGARGARSRLRARLARPDLRHAGRDRRRLGARRSTRRSARSADHVSAYALTVEPGTRLAARVRRGELPAPDDDVAGATATRRADAVLGAAGPALVRDLQLGADGAVPRTTSATGARTTGGASGPARTRTSAACAGGTCCTPRVTRRPRCAGDSPAAGRERLDAAQRALERTMLELRLADGPGARARSARGGRPSSAADGLLDPAALRGGRARLTLRRPPDRGRRHAPPARRGSVGAASKRHRERDAVVRLAQLDLLGELTDDRQPVARRRRSRRRRRGRSRGRAPRA